MRHIFTCMYIVDICFFNSQQRTAGHRSQQAPKIARGKGHSLPRPTGTHTLNVDVGCELHTDAAGAIRGWSRHHGDGQRLPATLDGQPQLLAGRCTDLVNDRGDCLWGGLHGALLHLQCWVMMRTHDGCGWMDTWCKTKNIMPLHKSCTATTWVMSTLANTYKACACSVPHAHGGPA